MRGATAIRRCPRKSSALLDLRIKLKERVERLLQLRADFLLSAFNQMHGDVRGLAALEADLRLSDFLDILCR